MTNYTLHHSCVQHRLAYEAADLVIVCCQLLDSCLDLGLETLAGGGALLLGHKLALGDELLQADSRHGRWLPGGVQGGLQPQCSGDAGLSQGPGTSRGGPFGCNGRNLLDGLSLHTVTLIAHSFRRTLCI